MKQSRCERNARKAWKEIKDKKEEGGKEKWKKKANEREFWGESKQRLSAGTELTARPTADLRCPVDG